MTHILISWVSPANENCCDQVYSFLWVKSNTIFGAWIIKLPNQGNETSRRKCPREDTSLEKISIFIGYMYLSHFDCFISRGLAWRQKVSLLFSKKSGPVAHMWSFNFKSQNFVKKKGSYFSWCPSFRGGFQRGMISIPIISKFPLDICQNKKISCPPVFLLQKSAKTYTIFLNFVERMGRFQCSVLSQIPQT